MAACFAMATDHPIFEVCRHYTITPPAKRYMCLKDRKYHPADLYTGSTGRYNQLGTGSVYLGESLETCAKEVGGYQGKMAYAVAPADLGDIRILDVFSWSKDNPDAANALLQPSGSGGWHPTQEISNKAHAAGFRGIRYPSMHNPLEANLAIWTEGELPRDAFKQVPTEGQLEGEYRSVGLFIDTAKTCTTVGTGAVALSYAAAQWMLNGSSKSQWPAYLAIAACVSWVCAVALGTLYQYSATKYLEQLDELRGSLFHERARPAWGLGRCVSAPYKVFALMLLSLLSGALCFATGVLGAAWLSR